VGTHQGRESAALRGTDMSGTPGISTKPMAITTECQPNGQWTAIDIDSYDGPGSPMGWGGTEADAIADLREQLAIRRSPTETGH
jgi:hypothetical protein